MASLEPRTLTIISRFGYKFKTSQKHSKYTLTEKQDMRTKELLKILQKNPDGISVKAWGNHYIPAYFKTGYFVALTDNEVQAIKYNITKLHELARKLNLKTYYFGYWKDNKTNKEYLDLSLHVQNKTKAIFIGQTFNQKAIFDCKKMQSIYLE
jgi:hypothetical protein